LATLHFKDTEDYWKNNVGSEFSEEFAVGSEAVGVRLAHFVMSDDKNDMEAPLASMFYMRPNFVLPKHDHDCYRVEVVIEGSVRIGDKILRAGDVSVSRPGEAYGPHIAGPTGALTVEIFSRQKGLAPNTHVDEWTEEALAEGAKFQAAVETLRAARGKK
jgi:hypothetical protein